MYNNSWQKCHHSICSISFLNALGQKIGSGTGFKIKDYLITNNHVYVAPGSSSVELRFVSVDGFSTTASKIIPYLEFQSKLVDCLPEDSWDFAILAIDYPEFDTIPSLELEESKSIKIGDSIAILGFQFDQINLSIKSGILSSRYARAGVKYMQLDASVNQGNSGGPLIDVKTNKVVGIVTRKHTGLTEAFDDLLKSFDGNIHVLQRSMSHGGISVAGVNPMNVLVVSQHQMKFASMELRRSANVGIGFAYELDKILEYFLPYNAS
jgi:hypothetical protein